MVMNKLVAAVLAIIAFAIIWYALDMFLSALTGIVALAIKVVLLVAFLLVLIYWLVLSGKPERA